MEDLESPHVTLFFSPTCAYCQQAREFLGRRNIEFVARDVSGDPDALRDLVRLTGKYNVPVIVVGDEVVIGFDRARLERLLPRRDRRKPRLGVSIATVRPNEGRPGGAYVGRVADGSSADRAGIRTGDIIVEMAHRPIADAHDVHLTLAGLSPGQQIPMTLWRNGHRLRLLVRL